MADDERTPEETEETPEVEGHGAKHVVAGGLAAAALIGGTAAAVKLTEDDSRTPAALSEQRGVSAPGNLRAADRDRDGYVTSAELAHEGFKWNVADLNERGYEVNAAGLALAGFKHRLNLVGEDGFMIKGESIMLKWGVSPELDKLLDGAAQEWSKKVREIDRDDDGYAAPEELLALGYKFNTAALEKAGYKFRSAELAKAGFKFRLDSLGLGGFLIKGEEVMLKYGVAPELDQVLDKI
jgi:hypothetical protein